MEFMYLVLNLLACEMTGGCTSGGVYIPCINLRAR